MYNHVREFMNMASFIDSSFDELTSNSNAIALVPSMIVTGNWASNLASYNSNLSSYTYFCNGNLASAYSDIQHLENSVNSLMQSEIVLASNDNWLINTLVYLSNTVGNQSYGTLLNKLSNTAYRSSNSAALFSNCCKENLALVPIRTRYSQT